MVEISTAERFVQDHQLDAQEKVLDAEILRVELELNTETKAETWRLLDELKLLRRSVQLTRRELHLIPVKRKRLRDRLKIKLYLWAVADRLK